MDDPQLARIERKRALARERQRRRRADASVRQREADAKRRRRAQNPPLRQGAAGAVDAEQLARLERQRALNRERQRRRRADSRVRQRQAEASRQRRQRNSQLRPRMDAEQLARIERQRALNRERQRRRRADARARQQDSQLLQTAVEAKQDLKKAKPSVKVKEAETVRVPVPKTTVLMATALNSATRTMIYDDGAIAKTAANAGALAGYTTASTEGLQEGAHCRHKSPATAGHRTGGGPHLAKALVIDCPRMTAPAAAAISCPDIGGGQDLQASVPTTNKASQCTRRVATQATTQTDPTSFRSSGCQTEAAVPVTRVAAAGSDVSCKFFPNKEVVDRHLTLHHTGHPQEVPRGPYRCLYCPFTSYTRWSVQCHERLHAHKATAGISTVRDREDSNVCKLCKERFSAREFLANHERCHSTALFFHCPFCSERFATRDERDRHQKTHAGKKPVVHRLFRSSDRRKTVLAGGATSLHNCSFCRESFRLEHDLASHKRVAHPSATEGQYACIVCREVFAEKRGLLEHNCGLIRSRMAGVTAAMASLRTPR